MLILYTMIKKILVSSFCLLLIAFFVFKIDGESRPYRKLIIISNYIKYYLTQPLTRSQRRVYRSDVNRLIAHAGGAVEGKIYTDSLEALEENYRKGARLLELDLQLTSDAMLVAVHSWTDWATQSGFQGELPPTHQQFMRHHPRGLTPLDHFMIVHWFTQHVDAYLVTDKVKDPLLVASTFPFYKERVYMELFSWSAFQLAKKIGIFAPMINGDLLLNDYYLRELKLNKVSYVALSRRALPTHLDRVEKMGERGVKVYLYHAQSDGFTDGKTFCTYIPKAYGIYFDFWNLP